MSATKIIKRVYKYPIQITDEEQIINAPVIDVVHVGLDPSGTPCVWAVIHTDEAGTPVTPGSLVGAGALSVWVRGTGHDLGPDVGSAMHLGSFVDGSFVWHVFGDDAT